MRLDVKYYGDLDVKLDKAIEASMKALGFTRWASGYDLTGERRDLCFEGDKDVEKE